MTTEQMDALDDAKTAIAPPMRSVAGVHKFADQTGNLVPAAVEIDIELTYDAKDIIEPWRYKLHFPAEASFRKFMVEAGFISYGTQSYWGESGSYSSASMAADRANAEADQVVRRYSKWVLAQDQTKKYTRIIKLS